MDDGDEAPIPPTQNAIDSGLPPATVDLTQYRLDSPSGGGETGILGAKAATSLIEEPLNHTRKKIAMTLIGMLALLIVVEVIWGGIFGMSCWVNSKPATCDLADRSLAITQSAVGQMFTAMVGLVGSVVGFYFGSNSGGR